MSKIANVRDLVAVNTLPPSRDMRRAFFIQAKKDAAKKQLAIGADGRLYVPEAKRGRGVGYNGKRRANRSDARA